MSVNSGQNTFVHFLIEADQQFLSNPQGWCAQVPGWSQHQLQQLLFVKFPLFQINFDHFFPPRGVQLRRAAKQLKGLWLLVDVFLGIDDGLGYDSGFRKKLLRFDTRLSALAVIAPVNFLWHICLLNC